MMIKAPGFDLTLNFDWTDKTPRCVSMLTAAPERTVVWKFNHKNHFKVISQHVYAWGKKFNYYYQHFFSPFFFHTAEPKVQKATLGDRIFYFYFFLPFFSPTGGLTKNWSGAAAAIALDQYPTNSTVLFTTGYDVSASWNLHKQHEYSNQCRAVYCASVLISV